MNMLVHGDHKLRDIIIFKQQQRTWILYWLCEIFLYGEALVRR